MAKRFTDTDKWLKNSWFIDLPTIYKMFWLYLCDMCDNIGIWECNFRVAEFAIGSPIDKDKAMELFGDRIKVINDGHKWWLVYFCMYQYGVFNHNTKNFPHQAYVRALKENGLLGEYQKGVDTLYIGCGHTPDCSQEEEEEKDKDKDKDKEKDKETPAESENAFFATILGHWNENGIISHKTLSERTKGRIRSILNGGNSVVDIKNAISNYSTILNGKQYYFKYKWTLQDFLTRGFEKFLDMGVAVSNYTRKDMGKPTNMLAPENKSKYDNFHKGGVK